jgi:hypothetical protein
MIEGWGLMRLDRTLFFAGGRRSMRAWDVRHAAGPQSFEHRYHEFICQDEAEQLKITLTWADPAPAVGVSTAPIMNDLDLRVLGPDATVYIGNDFDANGVSRPDSGVPANLLSNFEALNNVEMVIVDNPKPGEWFIDVFAFQVLQGNPGQGYALVVTATTKSGCFVASAVYGDPDHPDVDALRLWRDRHLRPGARGRSLVRVIVAAYEHLGPFAARATERHPALRRLLRARILPGLARASRREGSWR